MQPGCSLGVFPRCPPWRAMSAAKLRLSSPLELPVRATLFAWLLALAQGSFVHCTGQSLGPNAALEQRIQQLEARLAVLERLEEPADARAWFERRQQRDEQRLGLGTVRELEGRYQEAKALPADSAERLVALEAIVNDPAYAGSNRVGCALLYLGRWSPDEQAGVWLRRAVEEHSDAVYGDGVQVRAYARYELAALMSRRKKHGAARSLRRDLAAHWPDAVDHSGTPLVR